VALERIVHDENGRRRPRRERQAQSSTMLAYLVPTAGAPAAIHCAVNDALSRAGAGVFRQPMLPKDVLDALARGRTAG